MTHHIWYHAKCTDGLGAAYAAWSALGESGCRYTPVAYGDPLPPIDPEDEVTMLDFSAPRAELLRLAQVAGRITIIDHHASAEGQLAGLADEALATEGACEIRTTFDTDHSGAVLAWHAFRPNEDVPRLLQLIEDRDLWRFASPDSKPLHYGLARIEDFRHFSIIASNENELMGVALEGELILEYLEAQWASIAARAGLVTLAWFDGILSPGENPLCDLCPCPSAWFSDVGALLLDTHPETEIAVLYNDHIDAEHVTVSLRSRKGGPDVSRLAAHMGGGGHPNAAGFRIPLVFPSGDAGIQLDTITSNATHQEAA